MPPQGSSPRSSTPLARYDETKEQDMMMIPATEIRRYHQPRCLSNITMMIKIRDLLTILHNAHINQDQAMMMITMMKKCTSRVLHSSPCCSNSSGMNDNNNGNARSSSTDKHDTMIMTRPPPPHLLGRVLNSTTTMIKCFSLSLLNKQFSEFCNVQC